MAINTGYKSASFKVWLTSTVASLATGVFAAVEKKYGFAVGSSALVVLAGLFKTYHDAFLHSLEARFPADAKTIAKVADIVEAVAPQV